MSQFTVFIVPMFIERLYFSRTLKSDQGVNQPPFDQRNIISKMLGIVQVFSFCCVVSQGFTTANLGPRCLPNSFQRTSKVHFSNYWRRFCKNFPLLSVLLLLCCCYGHFQYLRPTGMYYLLW